MDPDDVARLVTELKLSNSHVQGESLTLEDADLRIGEQRLEYCLIAKVLSPKKINAEAFKQQMPRILQAVKPIEIGSLGDNIFILDFTASTDRRRALLGGPWNFFRDLIIFAEPRGLQNPRDMKFDKISLCVQCYNLPLILMYIEVLQKVGSLIGEVEEIDTRENGFALGRYVRIRICIDVKKPLKKSVVVSVNQASEAIIVFLPSERLPDFCYSCGCNWHSFRDCESISVNIGKLAYGGWLKAANQKGGAKSHRSSPGKTHTHSDENPSRGSMEQTENSGSNSSAAPDRLHSRMITLHGREEMDQSRGGQTRTESHAISHPNMEEKVLDITSGGNEKEILGNIGPRGPPLDSSKSSWKRRARDQGTRFRNQKSGDLEKGKEKVGEGHSPMKKRTFEESFNTTDLHIMAAVAKQPRRSQ